MNFAQIDQININCSSINSAVSMDISVVPHENNSHELQDDHEQTITNKNPKGGGWSAAIFLIFVEMAERFSYYGLSGNLITYLTTILHEPTFTAAKNVNTWIGVSAIFPLIGGFIADSYLGRFKTVLVSVLIYFVGMVLLTLSVSVTHSNVVFYVALYILAIGEGGHKPCVQTFAADQFDESNLEEKQAKSSFFNWWYLGIVFGASAAILVLIYIQTNVGWAEGFGVLAGVLAASLVLFLIGIKRYRKEVPVGSPFTKVAQVLVAAGRKWRVSETRGIYYGDDDENSGDNSGKTTLTRTNQLRFLDKAMVIDDIDSSNQTRDPWRLCSLKQVEQVKLALRLIPPWLACLMFFAVQVQTHTFFTKQGSTMIKSLGPKFNIPPASFQSVIGLAIIITVPIYDQIFVRMARKKTGLASGITMLQRIGIGLFFSIILMIVAALVEAKRLKTARQNGLMDSPNAIVPISIAWLLPQYIISGISDVFTVVGLQELFYDQVPDEMRSMGAACYISIVGIGSFINSAIIAIVETFCSGAGGCWLLDNLNRSRLDNFYWLLAGLSGLNLCVYIWIAKRFVYKKVVYEERELTHLDASQNEDVNLENHV